MEFDLRFLRILVSVADTGSLRKAAARLGLTQPALSKSIRQVERKLNTQLVIRTIHGTGLTPIGENFASRGREILLNLESLEQEIKEHSFSKPGSVRIGAGIAIAKALVDNVLGDFCNLFPKVEVCLETGDPRDLAHRVERGELDFAVGIADTLEDTEDLILRPLRRDVQSFFSSRNHPLADLPEIGPREIAPYRIVLPFYTEQISNWLKVVEGIARVEMPPVIICRDFSCICDLVSQGSIISISPVSLISSIGETRNFIPLTVPSYNVQGLAHCIVPRNRPLSSASFKLLEMIEKSMSNLSNSPSIGFMNSLQITT